MELWISGEIQGDVGAAYRNVSNLIEDKVNQAISDKDYGDGLREWSYIAIIREIDREEYGEVYKYWKKRKDAEFRLKIDHATFLAADTPQQIQLLSQSLLRSIKMMPEIGVKNFDHDRFYQDVAGVLAQLKG